jgi:NADH-quinone oxidoreductase subunit N
MIGINALIMLVLFSLLPMLGILSALLRSKIFAITSSIIVLLFIASTATVLIAQDANISIAGVLHFYPFSDFFIVLFSLLMILIEILSWNTNSISKLQPLFGFAALSILIVPASSNLLSLFIGLELFSVLASFMIIASGKHHFEAAVKFFILSALSVALFSIALALIMPYDGNFALSAAVQNPMIGGSALLVLAIAFFASALSFDSSMFPFNLWVPDVYEGAPSNITALIAGIGKKLAFVAIMEVFFVEFAGMGSLYSKLFIALSILTMFYGNLAAMSQKNMKRLFAYSSISQAGYIMIGIAVATQYGISASIVQIVAHAFAIVGAFAIIMLLESNNLKSIDDYTGMAGRNTFLTVSLIIIMLSMAGIPPLLGFEGKLLLFSSAINAHLLYLALLGVINSFISIYYYSKIMTTMLSRRQEKKISSNLSITAVVAIVIVILLVFGIYPQPIMGIASASAASLQP